MEVNILSSSDTKPHPLDNMDYSIDTIERSPLDPHFDELVVYIDRPIQTHHNLGFLMKIHLEPKDLTICRNNENISPTPSGFFYTQNLPGQISKLEKTTQAFL